MSNRGKTLVKGHALVCEGYPHDPDGRLGWGGSGYALCRCGAKSPVLESNAARKQWHREHKAEVAA